MRSTLDALRRLAFCETPAAAAQAHKAELILSEQGWTVSSVTKNPSVCFGLPWKLAIWQWDSLLAVVVLGSDGGGSVWSHCGCVATSALVSGQFWGFSST